MIQAATSKGCMKVLDMFGENYMGGFCKENWYACTFVIYELFQGGTFMILPPTQE